MTKNTSMVSKSKTRRGRRSRRNIVAQYVAPFPPFRNYRFRYDESVILQEAAAGSGYTYFWTPSSLFDPNNTGGGHQPMFYDQLCSSNGPYTRYRALHTDLMVQFNSNSTSPTTVVVFLATSGTNPTSVYSALEKPWKITKQLAPAGSAPTVQTVRMRIPHAAALGITEQHLRNDDYYAGDYNSSPTKNVFIGVSLWSQGGTIAYSSCVISLDITAQLFSLAATSTS